MPPHEKSDGVFMEYLSKAKELRNKVPIPLIEAINLLKQNNCDSVLCEQIFINNRISEIRQQTGCSEKVVRQKYIEAQFDVARTINSIREKPYDSYDRQYKIPDFLTLEKIHIIYQWLDFLCNERFWSLIDGYETIINVLKQMDNMTPIYDALVKAPEKYNHYFVDLLATAMYTVVANRIFWYSFIIICQSYRVICFNPHLRGRSRLPHSSYASYINTTT